MRPIPQDLRLAKDNLSDKLKLVRNFARTGRKPGGQTEDLEYIEVLFDEDGLLMVISDVGNTYFSEDVIGENVGVNTTLLAGDLRIKARDGVLLGSDLQIELESIESVGETRIVTIYSSGLVDE